MLANRKRNVKKNTKSVLHSTPPFLMYRLFILYRGRLLPFPLLKFWSSWYF